MGSRTIYVAKHDEALFTRAAEIAGGLSPAIAEALRLFVDRQEATMRGYDEVTVRIGDGSSAQTTRFYGRRLVRVALPGDSGRIMRYDVYRTQREQIAVHISDTVDWARTADPDSSLWDNNPAAWNSDWYRPGRRTLEVFATAEDIAGKLPDAILDATREALHEPEAQHLDI